MLTSDQVQKAYIAYFGRPAEPGGLEYWMEADSEAEMHAQFASSQEYLNHYADFLDDAGNIVEPGALLNQVYLNLFNREVEPGGVAWYAPALMDGSLTIDNVVIEVLAGASGADLTAVNCKLEASDAFTALAAATSFPGYDGPNDAAAANQWLSGIYDEATKDAALESDALQDAVDWVLAGGPGSQLGETHVLTEGLDIVPTNAGDVVYGDNYTLTPGDRITGEGDVFLTFGNETGYDFSGQTIDGANTINVEGRGDMSIDTVNWRNTGGADGTIVVHHTVGNVALIDLQQTTNDWASGVGGDDYALWDNYNLGDTISLNFDAQAVDTTDTVVDLGVHETHVTVALDGGDIETVNLHINDQAGEESVLTDLQVEGIETLNIDGGAAGLDFEITGALDPWLEVIDAHNAQSNLNLNVSESAFGQEMDITLGEGDDLLITGDTLGDNNEQDSIDGREGDDVVSAVFTTAGVRHPAMDRVETLDLTYNASATLDFSDIDDVETVNVNQSLFGGKLQDMDNTVTAINLEDGQVGPWDVDYEKGEDADLTFTWTNNNAPLASVITQIEFDEVQSLTMVADGREDIRYYNFSVDAEVTEYLAFNVTGSGDMAVFGAPTVIANIPAFPIINAVSVVEMSFTTEGNGDLTVNGGSCPNNINVIDAQELEQLTVSASENGDIHVGSIAFSSQLDTVDITTIGADVTVDAIFGYDIETYASHQLPIPTALTGATISTFNIESAGDNNEDVLIGFIAAEEISEMNVEVGSDSLVDLNDCGQWGGLWMTNSGDTLTVSGNGEFADLTFLNEAFDVMDFSGLALDDGDVWYENATGDVSYTGTAQNDDVNAGTGSQTIWTFGGNDDVYINNNNTGTNYINTGDGIDYVNLASGFGSQDTVDIGGTAIPLFLAGNDDTIRDFVSLDDSIAWGTAGVTGVNYVEADASGINNLADLVNGANAALDGTVIYAFGWDYNGLGDGYLFKDTNMDGTADLVIELLGADSATFMDGGDIIV